MGGQDGHVDGGTTQMEDMSLRQTNDIVINFSHCWLTLFIGHMLQRQYFIHGCHHIAINIILGNNITVGIISTDDNELMWVFIVPKDLVDSFIHEVNVVVSLSIRVEQIYFTVLVLEDELCCRFVDEHSEDWIVWFMLHDDILVLQMVKFQF